uniref:Uncharacterized protein n=1 Tax=Knipowitschia caucasica TaxID=637954 RepID=A0AAV2M523_KNICA
MSSCAGQESELRHIPHFLPNSHRLRSCILMQSGEPATAEGTCGRAFNPILAHETLKFTRDVAVHKPGGTTGHRGEEARNPGRGGAEPGERRRGTRGEEAQNPGRGGEWTRGEEASGPGERRRGTRGEEARNPGTGGAEPGDRRRGTRGEEARNPGRGGEWTRGS